MSCCNCTYHIEGCYNICYPIALELPAIEDGNYTVTVADSYYSFTATAADGVLTIPAGVLNESDCVTIQVSGYELTEGEQTYNCFKIKTTYSTTLIPVEPTPPDDFCSAVLNCIANSSEEQPFIHPVYNVFQGDTVFTINNFNLEFTGATVDGDLLVRDFDPFGNDIGGIAGSNTIGSDNLFNSIRGVGNTLGDDCNFNTVIGQNVVMGNDNGGSLIAATDAIIGDSTSYIFIIGEQSNSASNSKFSSSIGIGHSISANFQYYFGYWSDSINGGVAVGNGTSNLNRSNAFEARTDGSIRHSGAYANKPRRVTSGGSVTIPDNVSIYIYDPAVIQAGATITLPANPIDGQDLYIFGGGTITSGNVITGFTLDGNGRTIIGDGATTLKVGKAYELHYCAENNIWYAIIF